MSANPSVGRSIPRVDGADKVTGRALYVDDLSRPGMLHGRTVRSAVPHGRLRGITLDPDFDWSGITLATAEDIPGQNYIALIENDQLALVPVGGTIRHVDEAVALLAGPDKRRVAEALAHVLLDVEELSAVFDVEEALARTVVLHGEDNVFARLEINRGGDVDAALAGCDLVVEGTYRTGAQEQMYIEPNGIIAEWDEDGACTVVGSMQCPYYIHKALKPFLDLPDEKVIVEQAVTGGGFGGKEEYPSMLAAHAALLARKTGAPVKMIYDRAEDIRATTKRHPGVVRHRMGFREDGTLVAIDVDVILDGGAYKTLSPVVLSRGVLHAPGPYRLEHARVVGRAVATNHPPLGAFRGFGAPQTTFPYARQMQKAARLLGIDPWELHRKNMLREGDTTATGQVLTYSVGSAQVLDAAQEALARPSPYGRPSTRSAAEAVKRGRGLVFYFHGAGFTGSGEERLKGTASVAVAADGRLEVRSTSTDIGQGTLTTFIQIVADALGVEAAAIRFRMPRTGRDPDSGPTVASRTCMIMGAVVEAAAKDLRTKLLAFAGEEGLDPSDLTAIARRHAETRGELVERRTYTSPAGIKWDDATYTGDAYPVYAWAACAVDVAVDTDTYEVTIERCVHTVDVGKAIHPKIVQGQIEGGTLQAFGWALWERVIFENGRVLNDRMTNCIIPTSIEAPEMETILLEVPYPHGPSGAKGIGELPMDGPGAAVAAAIEDALGDCSACDELPILPEAIERALREGAA